MDNSDVAIIHLLSIPPNHRTPTDIARLHTHFRSIEGLVGNGIVSGPTSAHRDAQLRVVCQLARHRRVPGDVLLYQAGDLCDAWFVLLTGSVLIETSMFLPRACFGTRVHGGAFRPNDCLVLEPSDLIVIPYPDRDRTPVVFTNTHRQAVTNHKRRLSCDTPADIANSVHFGDGCGSPESCHVTNVCVPTCHLPERISSPVTFSLPVDQSPTGECKQFRPSQTTSRNSQLSSDTSSVQSTGDCYSDSGRASSYVSSERKMSSKESTSVTLSKPGRGTPDHSPPDSGEDDEDDFESSSHESLRDAFWESILKEPHERTEDDIQTMMENVQQLPAFSNLTKSTCRALCGVMVVAMVHEAGQVVLGSDEPLDTWSVILNGTVEVVEPDGTVRELTRGDSFGVRYGRSERTHRGVMRTMTEDCQFVCVPQSDYLRIMSREGEAEIPEVGEGGRVVLVYEAIEDAANTGVAPRSSTSDVPESDKTRVVTKGTPEKLIEHLVADLSNVDITYPEDFLLTYRTFLDSPQSIIVRLLSWHMHNPQLRPRVNRIVLLWVHNHFNDFEDSPEMMKFVENFDRILASDGTAGERRLLQLACSTKARPRQIGFDLPVHQTVKSHSVGCIDSDRGTTTTFTVRIPFTLIGGQDGFGIFIDHVDPQFSNALETNSWNPSGKLADSGSCSTGLSSSKPTAYLHRADQLLAINGRSVEHLNPSEVVQWIQSLGSLVADQANTSSSGGNLFSDSADRSSLNPVCNVTLSLIYNPVQYHQLLNNLDGKNSQPRMCSTCVEPSHSPRKTSEPLPSRTKLQQPLLKRSNPPASARLPCVNLDRVCEPVPAGLNRAGRSHERGSNKEQSSLLRYRSDSQSHSAHASPTRSDDFERGPAIIRVNALSTRSRGPTLWSAHPRGDDRLPRGSSSSSQISVIDSNSLNQSKRSSSQPDLLALGLLPSDSAVVFRRSSFYHPDCQHLTDTSFSVIRVWRATDCGRDQSSKLVLLPRRNVNALEATRLAIEEFGIPEEESDAYSLYHVTVEPGPLVKQSRLSNATDDLAGRMTLNARYYLKHNRSHEPLIADDIAKTILADSRVTFIQLVPEDLAIQLTLDDYAVFRAVQSTEYIDEVFGLINSNDTCLREAIPDGPVGYATGHDNLDRFTELVNREAYWVPTEICLEPNLSRRVDLLKRFIKLAKFCRDLRNYNTMFCLLVGLHQTPVERLKQTWERLPNKYQKMYSDLSMVLDTSRNFFQYRSLLTSSEVSAPMLPYLPLVLKDLTFIHLGNPSRTADGLVNFVKLRMLAKEIRAICRMCNVDYDLGAAQRLLRRSVGAGSRRARGWPSTSGTSSGNSKLSVLASPRSVWMTASGCDMTSNVPFPLDELKRQEGGADEEQHQHGVTSKRSGSVSVFSGSGNSFLTAAANVGSGSLGLSNLTGSRRRSAGATSNSPAGSSVCATVNVKKMYDSWLTTLRIRTYLANLNVNCDTESLAQLSARLEPGSKSAIQSSANIVTEQPASSIPPLSCKESSKSSTRSCPATDLNPSKPTQSTTATNASASTATVTTCATTATSASTSLVRPILGAQSVEDARKLLALSECHKRSQHRIPPFTFPRASQNNPLAHFVLLGPSSRRPVQYTQTQWPVENRQHHPSLIVSHPGPCSSLLQRNPTMVSQAYTFMGGNSLVLDSLVPMPQRITSMMPPSMNMPLLPQRMSSPGQPNIRCPTSDNNHTNHSNSKNWLFSSAVEAVSRSSKPQVVQSSRPEHIPAPCVNPRPQVIHPTRPMHQCIVGPTYTIYSHSNSDAVAQQNRSNPVILENGYRYPSANMHPTGVDVQRFSSPTNRVQRVGPQCIEWKPNHPPPYELALALRQQHQMSKTAGAGQPCRVPDQQQLTSTDSQSTSKHQIRYVRGFNAEASDSTILEHVHHDVINHELSSRRHQISVPSQPQGTSNPGHEQSISCQHSAPSRIQQRPVPPSYHQVVGMSRYGQQQQSVQTRASHDRPASCSATSQSERPSPFGMSSASSRPTDVSGPGAVFVRPKEHQTKNTYLDPRRR